MTGQLVVDRMIERAQLPQAQSHQNKNRQSIPHFFHIVFHYNSSPAQDSSNSLSFFSYFTGPQRHRCIHHKSVVVGFAVLLLQFTVGRQHLLESRVDAWRPTLPFIPITTLWIIGRIVIYCAGDYDKPICYDRPSTRLSQVNLCATIKWIPFFRQCRPKRPAQAVQTNIYCVCLCICVLWLHFHNSTKGWVGGRGTNGSWDWNLYDCGHWVSIGMRWPCKYNMLWRVWHFRV